MIFNIKIVMLFSSVYISTRLILYVFIGDPRLNQHFGLTLYHTMFTKFHNYLADQLKYILPRRTDEFIYQETRRIIGAANQIIAFRDYLPILLGIYYLTDTKCWFKLILYNIFNR